MMFVNISPAVYNLSETLCSLNFATRCRNVELGQAKKQIVPGNNAIDKGHEKGSEKGLERGDKNTSSDRLSIGSGSFHGDEKKKSATPPLIHHK